MGAIEEAIMNAGGHQSKRRRDDSFADSQLTEERRKDLVKQARQRGEECKIAIEITGAVSTIFKMEKEKEISGMISSAHWTGFKASPMTLWVRLMSLAAKSRDCDLSSR